MSGSAGIDFAVLIGPVARHLLGEPNSALSTARTLRFGNHGSLAVEIGGDKHGRWFDHEDGVGGGTLDLIARETRCTNGEAVSWLREHGFIPVEPCSEHRIVIAYDYRDTSGALLFQVCRFEPKAFRQRQADGNGGWIWNLAGIKRVPYRLQELLNSPVSATVFLPEGERDVDALRTLGLVATCNPGGAGKWVTAMSAHLSGRDVVILPDNDDAGERHALDVARKLHGIARTVRILRLPGLSPKGDVSNWIFAGGTVEELKRMAAETAQRDGEAAEPPKAETSGDACRPPAFSDDVLALAFADRHNGRLLYVPAWSSWLRWDGVRWARDQTLDVFDAARAICREAATEAAATGGKNVKTLARKIAGASTIAAVERLARCDPRHARSADAFDRDLWALNTPGGVVNLRTGHMRPHRAADLFTKATTVAPADSADCPRWLTFLDEIAQGDAEMVAFLQRAIGYSLTADIREHAFFFLHGPGSNGKSVLLGTVGGLLGDYATAAMPDVVAASHNDQHPTHIAALRSARFVTVSEVEEGRPWAENRIKSLTGGDRISARVMRGDPFDFSPVLKLWVAGNHRPVLRNPDPAMRRRLHLVPMTFVPLKPDLVLPERLRVEMPGILRWAIEGCLAWQQRGLDPPPAVREATDSYFAEQDSIATWVAERTERRPRAELGCRMAFLDWKAWALARGEEAGTEKRFSAELERHAGKKKTNRGMVFLDLWLLPTEAGAW
ncbi:MAG: phage/plasmid primase, P4 family [Acetobacteraceae bacterium]